MVTACSLDRAAAELPGGETVAYRIMVRDV